MAQYKNCPFRVNATVELKNKISAPHSKGVSPDIFQLTNVPVLLDAVVIFFSSTVALTTNKHFFNTFTAMVDLSRSNFSIARAPLFQLKSAT